MLVWKERAKKLLWGLVRKEDCLYGNLEPASRAQDEKGGAENRALLRSSVQVQRPARPQIFLRSFTDLA